MTADTTYQTDDGQLAQEHDQVILENNLIEPDAELAEENANLMSPDAELAEPDADPMAPHAGLAEPNADSIAPDADSIAPDADLAEPDADLAEPDGEHMALEDPTSHPASVTALADQESATSIASRYPGFTSDGDDGAEEPGTADSGSSSPSLVSVDFTVSESVTESHTAGNTAGASGPWNEIQAMFVDDPRASVERAAGLVNDQVEELVQSVREWHRSMQAGWQAEYAGTEELRVALQRYRTFWNSIMDCSPQG
jgi:hypothetical protein